MAMDENDFDSRSFPEEQGVKQTFDRRKVKLAIPDIDEEDFSTLWMNFHVIEGVELPSEKIV